MKVAITECKDYSSVDNAVKDCLDRLGGIGKFVKKSDKVLLKINQLSAKKPEDAVTTHPLFVAAVIKEVRGAGGDPSVGDSPAMHSLETVAKKSGIYDICSEMNVPLVELDDPDVVENEGKRVRSFKISKKLQNFEVIINLPKLKTHSLTGLTCAVKNLFGCIPGKIKGGYHLRFQNPHDFSEMLLDLHEVIKPNLTIVDGVIGMEGQGPGAGDPREIGVIIAGENALAVDTVVMSIVGMRDKEVPTVFFAKKRGFPGAYMNNIEVVGVEIQKVRVKNFKRPKSMMNKIPPFFFKMIKKVFTAKPVVIAEKCIGCRNCKNICPNHAIEMVENIPKFDYNKCIRCYCCHEICPEKAIPLKKGFILGILSKIIK